MESKGHYLYINNENRMTQKGSAYLFNKTGLSPKGFTNIYENERIKIDKKKAIKAELEGIKSWLLYWVIFMDM